MRDLSQCKWHCKGTLRQILRKFGLSKFSCSHIDWRPRFWPLKNGASHWTRTFKMYILGVLLTYFHVVVLDSLYFNCKCGTCPGKDLSQCYKISPNVNGIVLMVCISFWVTKTRIICNIIIQNKI